MPPGPHNFRGNIYSLLKDVLERPAQINSDRVYYRPSTANKRYLEAAMNPEHIDQPTGPELPTITVKWKRDPTQDEFRIDYADPNVEFHCGWHRDDDHPEYGDTHFQYTHLGLKEPIYEAALFDATSPPRILWEALEQLFDDVIPSYAAPLYEKTDE